jgi:hypothetical protein
LATEGGGGSLVSGGSVFGAFDFEGDLAVALHSWRPPTIKRQVERSLPVACCEIEACAAVKQPLDRGNIPLLGSLVKRRPSS